jgi:haloacid dehalogenase-like hydrolase
MAELGALSMRPLENRHDVAPVSTDENLRCHLRCGWHIDDRRQTIDATCPGGSGETPRPRNHFHHHQQPAPPRPAHAAGAAGDHDTDWLLQWRSDREAGSFRDHRSCSAIPGGSVEGKVLSVPIDEIATIGDMPNDVLMSRNSGLGIAMGNASPDVQAQADAVTASYEDEGFAKAVEQFILHRVSSLSEAR